MSKPKFINELKNAHNAGDLSDVKILKKAMMYENYLNCSKTIKSKIIKEEANLNPELDSQLDSQNIHYLQDVDKNPTYTPKLNIHNIFSAYHFLDEKFEFKVNKFKNIKSSAERVKYFNKLFKKFNSSNKEKCIWLYEDDIDSKTQSIVKILQKLGMAHIDITEENASFFQLIYEPQECYKPNWLNAKLAYYFYQSKNGELPRTRSLLTGNCEYIEMIYFQPSNLQLKDVRLHFSDEYIDLSALSEEYKNIQKQRIKSKRIETIR